MLEKLLNVKLVIGNLIYINEIKGMFFFVTFITNVNNANT